MKNDVLIVNNRDTLRIQGYQIMAANGVSLANACGQFMYKGFQVSFSTAGYADGACCNEVAIFDQADKLRGTVHSVQKAIEYIDLMLK